MSRADEEFIRISKDIIETGTSSERQTIRAKWLDGTPAHTKAKFCVVSRFNLAEEFPVVTLRKTPIKSAVDELLWIWQKKSNNVNDLGSHIWDSWADENGSIGKAYGYQLGRTAAYPEVTEEGLMKTFPDGRFADSQIIAGRREFRSGDEDRLVAEKIDGVWNMDQVDKVIYDLKVNSFSRRIMTTIWNPEDLHEMHLQPCAWNVNFMVEQRPGHEKLTLNMILNQRSQDMLAAFAWNTAQYAVLQHMMAQVAGMEVGEMVHVNTNCHLYDRHIPIVEELIQREPKPAPLFWLNPEVKDFYDFTPDDVKLDGYEVAGPQVKFEVAV